MSEMCSWLVSSAVALVLAACSSSAGNSGNGSETGGAFSGAGAATNTGGAAITAGGAGTGGFPSSGGMSFAGANAGGSGPAGGGGPATGGALTGISSCGMGAKLCSGSCVLPAAANGCSDPGCAPCSIMPTNGFPKCVNGQCDFGCFSGFVKSQNSCVLPSRDAGPDAR